MANRRNGHKPSETLHQTSKTYSIISGIFNIWHTEYKNRLECLCNLYWQFHPLRMTDGGLLLSPKSECKQIIYTTLLKPHNIGTHFKGIETSFQVVPLFVKFFHFWVSYITFLNFLKIPSVFKGLMFQIRECFQQLWHCTD
jgi:hypothetical protein